MERLDWHRPHGLSQKVEGQAGVLCLSPLEHSLGFIPSEKIRHAIMLTRLKLIKINE